MQLKDFVIALVIFGMVVVAAGAFVGDISTNYNASIDTAFIQHYNTLDSMNQYASDLQNSINTKSITPGSLVGILLDGIGGFFTLLFQLITFPITLMAHIWQDIGLPANTAWIATAICTILAIAVIFAIVNAALRSKV
jgi:hypothetical protein